MLIPGVLAALVLPLRHDLALSTVLLIFLLGVLANALIGGVLPAALAAVIAGVLANLLFTPPYGSLTIAQPENAFALVVFVVVGVTVASVVDRSAVRASQATRGRAEAQLVASVATEHRGRHRRRARGTGAGQGRIRDDVGRAAVHRRSRAAATGQHGRCRRADSRRRRDQSRWCRCRGAGRHRLGSGAVRATADAVGPRAGRGVRGSGGARRRAGSADISGPAGGAAQAGRQGANRRAGRVVARSADPAGHHQGVRVQPAGHLDRLDRGGSDASCWPPPTRPPISWTRCWRICSTCPGCRPVCWCRCAGRPRWTRWCTGR